MIIKRFSFFYYFKNGKISYDCKKYIFYCHNLVKSFIL